MMMLRCLKVTKTGTKRTKKNEQRLLRKCYARMPNANAREKKKNFFLFCCPQEKQQPLPTNNVVPDAAG
jgi:hypothetical protein